MNWLSIALITPITHAIANHMDKYVLSKYLKNAGIGFLVIFSAFFSFLCLPIITLIYPAVFAVHVFDAFVLAANGGLIIIAYILYFIALQEDEASIVTPLFQFIPVFGFILGYVLLGEVLTRHQIGGSIIIACGAFLLSIALDGSKIQIKKKVLFMMLGASLLYAI
ncbi:MAG TPA: EamA family transporter, partial [Candidatus Andersenbacteria bacterium]|nr:EamA family transporter [Candidatus Andersenbacteria bacterium]